MRWSETITIYLAAGAPFSVSCYLHEQKSSRQIIRFLWAAVFGFLWPLAVMRILLVGIGKPTSDRTTCAIFKKDETRIQNLKRNLLASLHEMSEVAAKSGNSLQEDLERATCVLRESVETIVGLSSAVEEATEPASSNANVIELFRIAGYQGKELGVASMCANRRNVARIISHRTRARTQMVHSIADIGEVIECSCTSMASIDNTRLRLAFTEVYKFAIALLVLIGEEESANRIAVLLNYESSRPSRVGYNEIREDWSRENGEEPCSTQSSRPPQVPASNEATMAQG